MLDCWSVALKKSNAIRFGGVWDAKIFRLKKKTAQEDSNPDFFTRLKHRSEHWKDQLYLGIGLNDSGETCESGWKRRDCFLGVDQWN